jgi:poly(3-hydroxybutyrate) depolymerase
VVTRADPQQTYALYLPSTYTSARRWPVLFAFDPGARGYRAVECFRAAAEKHGYILAASNVSQNGPMEVCVRAAMAMMRDVLERFAPDDRRLYVTGFSGGAWVASAMALMQKGRIAGVIACSGGFPSGVQPDAALTFTFCGTAGNQDFNWIEVHRLERVLTALGKPHRLLRFAGTHDWPPADTAMAAVEWLELEAMRAGTRPKDAALVEGWLRRDLERVEAFEAAGSLHEAWLGYADLSVSYRGLADVARFETRAAALGQQEAVKREARRAQDDEQRELRQRDEIVREMRRMLDVDRQAEAGRILHAIFGQLERTERNGRTPAERFLARRVLEFASITAYDGGERQFDAGAFRTAAAFFQMQADLHPELPATHFRVSLAHARAGDRDRALDALKKAADAGFANLALLETEPAFEPWRSEERFRRVLETVRANDKTPR